MEDFGDPLDYNASYRSSMGHNPTGDYSPLQLLQPFDTDSSQVNSLYNDSCSIMTELVTSYS